MAPYTSKLALVIGNPAVDVLIIIFFLAAGFLWGLLGGKSKLLSFLFATYVGLFLSSLVFKMLDEYMIAPKSQYRNIAVYFSILIVVFIILERMVLRIFSRVGYRWWQAFLMSFLAVGLFVSGTLAIVSLKGILVISPLTRSLFVGSSAYLFWVASPLLGLLLVSRGK
ncbi:MAG: hypothetical protein AAB482_04660 [Patescibacteria group bacterium]